MCKRVVVASKTRYRLILDGCCLACPSEDAPLAVDSLSLILTLHYIATCTLEQVLAFKGTVLSAQLL